MLQVARGIISNSNLLKTRRHTRRSDAKLECESSSQRRDGRCEGRKFPAQTLIIFPRWTGHCSTNRVFLVICAWNRPHSNPICVKAPLRGKLNFFSTDVSRTACYLRWAHTNSMELPISILVRKMAGSWISASRNKAEINNRVRREPLLEMKCCQQRRRWLLLLQRASQPFGLGS